MTLKKEVYYLSPMDLKKLANKESIDIMTKDGRHIQLLFNKEGDL